MLYSVELRDRFVQRFRLTSAKVVLFFESAKLFATFVHRARFFLGSPAKVGGILLEIVYEQE